MATSEQCHAGGGCRAAAVAASEQCHVGAAVAGLWEWQLRCGAMHVGACCKAAAVAVVAVAVITNHSSSRAPSDVITYYSAIARNNKQWRQRAWEAKAVTGSSAPAPCAVVVVAAR